MEKSKKKATQAKSSKRSRCSWCGEDPKYVEYHDNEWGVPVRNDNELFEMLILEGFQAGLSWLTILRKRDNFRKAFGGFRPERIAKFSARDVQRLMKDQGIVRNRMKIEATIQNAKAFVAMKEDGESFSDYLWSFTGNKTLRLDRMTGSTFRSKSPESIAMSKALKKRGFNFVGPTICYAFMQATGIVDDHVESCFRYKRRK